MIPDRLQCLLGYVNDVATGAGEVLRPFIHLILAVSALVIVIGSVVAAFEHLTHLRKHRDVLAAVALGADVIVACVLLHLISINGNPVDALCLVATAAIAIAVRMGVAKLGGR